MLKSGGCGAGKDDDEMVTRFGMHADMYPGEQVEFTPARFGMHEDMYPDEEDDFRPVRFGMHADMPNLYVGSFAPMLDDLEGGRGCGGGCTDGGCGGGCDEGGCGSGEKRKRGDNGDKHYRTRPEHDDDGVGGDDPLHRWDRREQRVDDAQAWVDELRDQIESMSDFERRLWDARHSDNDRPSPNAVEEDTADDDSVAYEITVVATTCVQEGVYQPPENECDDKYPTFGTRSECPVATPTVAKPGAVYRASVNGTDYCGDT